MEAHATDEDWEVDRDVAVPRLVDRYAGLLHGLARRLCRSPEEAEDLVQEVFLSAYRGWDGFERRGDPSSWLWTIASRACQRMHRKRSGEPERVETLEPERDAFAQDELGAAPVDGLDAAERKELLELLRGEIAGLPHEFRMPLVLKEVVGLPVGDVADALGVPVGTVKSRLHRARVALREALENGLPKRGVPPAAYDRAVCRDLLEAKQDALDRGAVFPVGDEVVCERCRTVFENLDLACELVRGMAGEPLAPELRERLLERVRRAG
ncbi:MAG: sigma-70 family RNA polymerase sigma factor [Planctomycetota bacterium]